MDYDWPFLPLPPGGGGILPPFVSDLKPRRAVRMSEGRRRSSGETEVVTLLDCISLQRMILRLFALRYDTVRRMILYHCMASVATDGWSHLLFGASTSIGSSTPVKWSTADRAAVTDVVTKLSQFPDVFFRNYK